MNPRQGWRTLPGGHGEVLLAGERPALRSRTGHFLRLHQVPESGTARTRRYLLRVRRAAVAREREARSARWPREHRRVLVAGGDALARALADELARSGAVVRRVTLTALRSMLLDAGIRRPGPAMPQALLSGAAESGPERAADLVVDVRDAVHRPDSLLDALLDGLPERGTAVLRGRREGARMLLFPLAIDGTEATPDQVRRRRLAASPAAQELDRWLRDGRRKPRPLRPRAVVLTVARCLAIAEDWAAGRPVTAEHRRLLRIVDEDLREREHTVLGFDEPPTRPAERSR